MTGRTGLQAQRNDTAPGQQSDSAGLGESARRPILGRVADARLSSRSEAVWRQKLTYLTPAKLQVIEAMLRRVQGLGVAGDFVEFGVALGGSAVVIASSLDGSRRFIGIDVFGMISPGGLEDAASARDDSRFPEGMNDGHLPDLYECVHRTFKQFGLDVDGDRIILHRGDFQNALEAHDVRTVAFAHVDCDWYKPVQSFLSAVWKRMSPGGLIVLDDYAEHGGCRRAVEAFLDEHREFRVVRSGPNAVLQHD